MSLMMLTIYLKKYFGFTSVELADKLINATSKEENQKLINDIEIN